METDRDRLISPEELMRWLGVGRTKVYSMLASSEIPSFKINRLRRVRVGDVEAWLDRNRYRPGK